jgi:uncharacterized membrane protein YfcA
VCQVFGHGAKLLYFASIVHDAAGVDPVLAAFAVVCSLIGTRLARRLLEAITDNQFRLWAKRLITAVSLYYVAQGTYLLTATVAD